MFVDEIRNVVIPTPTQAIKVANWQASLASIVHMIEAASYMPIILLFVVADFVLMGGHALVD